MFQEFPYTNFHELNLDWIVKIAKDFLDQYTHIQEVIQTGLEDLAESRETGLADLAESRATGLSELNQKTLDGLADLQEKYDTLYALLQAWYDTHSADIAGQLAVAIADFNSAAGAKSQELLDSWPDDYSELVTEYNNIKSSLSNGIVFPSSYWESGSIKSADGTNNSVEGNIRIKSLIYLDDSILSAYTSGTGIAAYVYQTDDTYLGAWQPASKSIAKSPPAWSSAINFDDVYAAAGITKTTGYIRLIANPDDYTKIRFVMRETDEFKQEYYDSRLGIIPVVNSFIYNINSGMKFRNSTYKSIKLKYDKIPTFAPTVPAARAYCFFKDGQFVAGYQIANLPASLPEFDEIAITFDSTTVATGDIVFVGESGLLKKVENDICIVPDIYPGCWQSGTGVYLNTEQAMVYQTIRIVTDEIPYFFGIADDQLTRYFLFKRGAYVADYTKANLPTPENLPSFDSVGVNFHNCGFVKGDIIAYGKAFKNLVNNLEPEISILMIGNSFTQDEASYLPALFHEAFPTVNCHFAILYSPGASLLDQYDKFTNNTAYNTYSVYNFKLGKWKNTSNSETMKAALSERKWDIITFQQNSANSGKYETIKTNLNTLINAIYSYIDYPTKMVYILNHSWGDNASFSDSGYTDSNDMYDKISEACQNVYNETIISDIIPTGTAIQNARTIPTLDALGASGHLVYDTEASHLQEGIPCLVTAYLWFLKVCEFIGQTRKGIVGSQIRPDDTWVGASGQNIPLPHGNCVGVSDANCLLAMKCAIAAYKKPFEITDCHNM